jgi:hypothetical protein
VPVSSRLSSLRVTVNGAGLMPTPNGFSDPKLQVFISPLSVRPSRVAVKSMSVSLV